MSRSVSCSVVLGLLLLSVSSPARAREITLFGGRTTASDLGESTQEENETGGDGAGTIAGMITPSVGRRF